MRRVAAVSLIVALLASGARPAAAQDAEQLIDRGLQLRKNYQNEEAARLFLRAYTMTKSPRAVAHLGTAEYDLGRWLEAEMHLAEALKARNDPFIEKYRAEIKRALVEVRSRLGWLEVVGRPAGAEVEVAGRSIGRLPLAEPIRLEAGEVYVRVTAHGYDGYERAVIVPNEQTARVVIDLEPLEAAEIAARNRSGAAPGHIGPPGSMEVRAGGNKNSWRWPAAWVSAGFATLLTGAGVAGSLVYSSKVSEFDALKVPGDPKKPRCSTGYPDSGGGPCVVLLAEANQARTIAIGSFIGAGAAAILATVLFATAPSAAERRASAPAVTCLPDLVPGRSGASCHFRF